MTMEVSLTFRPVGSPDAERKTLTLMLEALEEIASATTRVEQRSRETGAPLELEYYEVEVHA